MRPFYAIALAPLVLAAPPVLARGESASTNPSFSLTSVSSSGYAASTSQDLAASQFNELTFKVHDPDPKTNATTKCTLKWSAAGQPPQEYSTCKDPSFNMQVGSANRSKPWKGPGSFGLSVSHGIVDDSMGPAPYNHRRTFVAVDLDASSLVCKTSQTSARQVCELKQGRKVTMAVKGVSG